MVNNLYLTQSYFWLSGSFTSILTQISSYCIILKKNTRAELTQLLIEASNLSRRGVQHSKLCEGNSHTMSVTIVNLNNLLKVLVKNKTQNQNKTEEYKWKFWVKHRSNILLCQKKALLVKMISVKVLRQSLPKNLILGILRTF